MGTGKIRLWGIEENFSCKGVLFSLRPPHAARLRSCCPQKGQRSDGRQNDVHQWTEDRHALN